MGNEIKGILVGCDDLKEFGYEWVINHNDWGNDNTEITNNVKKYKNEKNFKIYFYVYKKTRKKESAKTSDEYRGTIFGKADIKNVERNINDPKKFVHHVIIMNFEHFEPKIKLEDIEHKLQKDGWKEGQKSYFGLNLSHHGLLLTEKDCNSINKLTLLNVNNDKNIKKTDVKI